MCVGREQWRVYFTFKIEGLHISLLFFPGFSCFQGVGLGVKG